MDTFDLVIVGGGPAGSSCAWKLKEAGLDVAVMDKSGFPRDKVCAGWVTPYVLDALEIKPDAYARKRVLQPIRSFRTGLIGGEPVFTRYDKPVSYGIRRCEFDHFLLERCGARLLLGEAADRIERREAGWIINGHIHAPMLIGAGGHFCPVARLLADPAAKPPVVAQEIEFEMSEEQTAGCRVENDTPELYFCPDLLGYGWCFRKGDYINIGLGRRDRHRLSAHVQAFCAWLKQTGRIAWDVPPHFKGHAYHTYEQVPRRLVDEGIVLIGDAAGLAFEESGEGIRPAVESGLLAADVLLACKGDYSLAQLSRYEALLRKRYGSPGGFDALSLLPAGLKQAMARKLFALPLFARRVLIERWFLHLHQAPVQAD